MKLLRLKVDGFRSLKSIDWKPGGLNIVIGPNASGKSNLLDLFEVLSCLPEGRLADYVQSRGGMNSLLWDGTADGIRISLDTAIPSNANGKKPGTAQYWLHLVSLGPFASCAISEERLEAKDGASSSTREQCPRTSTESLLAVLLAGDGAASRFANAMKRLGVYRVIDTSSRSTIRTAQIARYQTRVDSDGSNLVTVLHTLYTENRGFAERVNLAMGAAFDHFEKLEFPPSPAADQRVQMKVRWKGLKKDCPLWEISDGTLRFLHLITVLADPNPPPLIAIDEPETGLHPRMLALVAEYAADAARRTQVVLTTHSPEFLDAFRDTQPTVTVAQIVDGATELRTISGEDLSHWLEEFSLGEIYRSRKLELMG